ncbi:MAG TPA: RDD family protein [Cytophagales bacterium]|nr:RDD family protein [Cytophagales bacterium]
MSQDPLYRPHLGARMLAGLIDYVVVFGACIIFVKLFGKVDEQGKHHFSDTPVIMSLLFWALWTVGAEQILGATWGNRLLGLKPVTLEDPLVKPALQQSFKRHLLDMVDMSLLGPVSMLMVLFGKDHQRLGDIWAGTIVVKAEVQQVLKNMKAGIEADRPKRV